ncbi:MAG: phosphotransferase, partial [Thermoanaerobaculia bacterium]
MGRPIESLEALAGDVSLRRYFRVRMEGSSRVVAAYPESLRTACERWLLTDRLLTAAGVRTPRVLATDCDAGFMLLEDLGSATLQDRANGDDPAFGRWLEAAVEACDRIRELDRDAVA